MNAKRPDWVGMPVSTPEAAEIAGVVAMLKEHNGAVAANIHTICEIKNAIERDDCTYAAQLWLEIDPMDRSALWVAPTKGGIFTTAERAFLRTNEFNKALKELYEPSPS